MLASPRPSSSWFSQWPIWCSGRGWGIKRPSWVCEAQVCYVMSSRATVTKTATRHAMATNSAIQTKKLKNAVGVRSARASLKNKNRSNRPARPWKNHSPAHHPNTNKLTTTEQKQSQEKVDKTAEKRRAATTAATQSGAYVISGWCYVLLYLTWPNLTRTQLATIY